jgi:uncharacterized protein YdeI (YjbR/CyaY-like superfamily)
MSGEYLLGLSRGVREEAGVEPGADVEVTLVLDREPRQVELPAELAAALAHDTQAQVNFEVMSFTHRKEFARWISEAKRQDTRQRRIEQALQMIRAGQTRR